MNYAEIVNAIKVLDAAYKPCSEHGWNRPCLSCGLERRLEDERMSLRTLLGRVGIPIHKAVAAKMRQNEMSK